MWLEQKSQKKSKEMGLERQPILLILSLNLTVEFDYPVSSLLAVDGKFYF